MKHHSKPNDVFGSRSLFCVWPSGWWLVPGYLFRTFRTRTLSEAAREGGGGDRQNSKHWRALRAYLVRRCCLLDCLISLCFDFCYKAFPTINSLRKRKSDLQTKIMTSTSFHRQRLDQLFAFDSIASVVFGLMALLSPHHMVEHLGGGYNHSTHEALRYVCLC